MTLADNWSKLDLRWNQQGCIYWPQVLPESDFTRTTLEKYDELVNAPYIVHFLSQSKPWNFKCMHPLTHRFIYYLKESQWFTKTEWMKWWYKYYYSRFKWLLGDLNETLNMVKIK
ncbi:glycosyltransferase [Aliifodinibius sp. S!AR15-10]|uniref:glycosyltransferase n=1 Tax=Aliifodinibius sp. S!AR15-10 TaxID=2950437 RepID=UPI0038F7655E